MVVADRFLDDCSPVDDYGSCRNLLVSATSEKKKNVKIEVCSLHDDDREPSIYEKVQDISCAKYWQFIKQKLAELNFIVYVLTFCSLKAIITALLMWLPSYIQSQGYQ